LSDVDKVTSRSFGVIESDSGNANRMSILLDPNGRIVKVYNEVKPADHPGQVLADLENA
jgi:peroxiredoxin Q/BCP